MRYIATVSVPGYLPMDDDPPVFGTPGEAWSYLADERRESEDAAMGDYYGIVPVTDTVKALDIAAQGTATGTVYGPTPGYDGDHDLGLAYTVSPAEGHAPRRP